MLIDFLFTLSLLITVNCYTVDPDEDRDVPQIIESRGFIAESHYVTTKDGYILTVHRIVNPNYLGDKLKPVILQHGLLTSSVDFVVNSPDGHLNDIDTSPSNNLGFELAKHKFDVWMGNSRGNSYSLNHTKLAANQKKFWDFSFDEMVKYDMPAVIDYIRNHTQSATVAYVGHSQGTGIMFGLLSTQPQYNDIIRPYIALAPVTNVTYFKSPIKYLAYDSGLVELMKLKGGPFLPAGKWMRRLATKFCPIDFEKVCSEATFLLMGFDRKQLNVTRLPVYVAQGVAGTSAQNLVHWAQLVRSRQFRMYDHGKVGNMHKYGRQAPPEYDLTKIQNKFIALFSASNDWMADPRDVQSLRDNLRVDLIGDYVVPYASWNHLDFVMGRQTGKYVNGPVLDLLRKYA
ncbi:Lysosomal acid lipase/cholesteryl ester hydrolase [Halotydeus destructor]|nr:Lysosomal acid lipase/cholesteryl ester hydrolase [Halotydeus destructor]